MHCFSEIMRDSYPGFRVISKRIEFEIELHLFLNIGEAFIFISDFAGHFFDNPEGINSGDDAIEYRHSDHESRFTKS